MTNNQRIDVQAARWAVRLHAAALAADEQHELDRWMEADARHRGALLRAQGAWHDLDRLVALAAGSSRAGGLEKTGSAPVGHTAGKARFFAAAVLLIAVVAAAAWGLWPGGTHYSTPIGGLDDVRLADGSRVTLNTDTSIHVLLKDKERHIQLDKGEALFQVPKDPVRPFIVRVGAVSVRAVGTVFAVRAIDGRVDVTVTEGAVELRSDGGPGGSPIRRISANEHATIVQTRRIEVHDIPQDEAERRIAWRGGVVDFAGESLAAAVEEINRHNRRRIVIDDPALAQRPVVGMFKATDPDNFAATVAVALGAHSVALDDAIHLRQDSSPSRAQTD